MATPEAVLAAAAVLRSIKPKSMDGELTPELSELRDAGKALFQRLIIQERFGEADVVDYLKEKSGHNKMLAKLELLQKEIHREHELRINASKQADINRQREERLAAIEASCERNQLEGGNSTTALCNGEGDLGPSVVELEPDSNEGEEQTGHVDEEALRNTANLPRGSFRRRCGVCKCAYTTPHGFYHLVRSPVYHSYSHSYVICIVSAICVRCTARITELASALPHASASLSLCADVPTVCRV